MNARMPLIRFERLARRLIEDSFQQLFGGQFGPLELGVRLAHAMEDGKEQSQAPDQYRIQLNEAEYAALIAANPAVVDELAAYLIALAEQADLQLQNRPVIQIEPSAAQRPRTVLIDATHKAELHQTTRVQKRLAPQAKAAEWRQRDAFLVIDGGQHIALNGALFSIGRRADNDIVLAVSAVSRYHAQIRWRFGRFMLFDLNSRGGTFVNGARVTECVLHAGDVVRLSSVRIVYGEGVDRPVLPSGGETQIMPKRSNNVE